jgi:hypothetical protein
MKLTLIFFAVFALFSSVLGSIDLSDRDALVEACKEINGGGTKVRLEFDLSGACRGNCGGKKKKKKVEAIQPF